MPRDSQTCTLPDGRTLGFAEYGDPAGHPVVYLHGFPGSRLDAAFTDTSARRHRVRVLSLDRPGLGLSTRQPGRTMHDYPADVRAFAACQGLDTFGLLGVSGGGPYALALAHALPATQLSHVGVLAGAGPWTDAAVWRHIPLRSKIIGLLAMHCRWGLRAVVGVLAGSIAWALRTRLGAYVVDRMMQAQDATKGDQATDNAQATDKQPKSAPAPGTAVDLGASMVGGDFEDLGAPSTDAKDDVKDDATTDAEPAPTARSAQERRDAFLRPLLETAVQGSAGIADDAIVLCADPGFRPEDVTFNPVAFWYGDCDVNVPLAWAQPSIERVPHSVLRVFPGRDHLTLAEEADEILSFYSPAP